VPETGNNVVTSFEGQEILSIRLSTDGFSFYIYNPRKGSYSLSTTREVNDSISLTANLKHEYQELDFLQGEFAGVNIVVSGRRFTYVPKELLDEDDADLVFHYNQEHRDNEVAMVNQLKNGNAAVLFGLDKSTQAFVDDHFHGARFYSQSALLCDYFAVKSRGGVARKMYVAFRGDGLDLFAYEQGSLIMANSFDTSRDADNTYYILAAWKQLGMNQETDELYLTGNAERINAIEKELKRYVKSVDCNTKDTDFDIQELNIDYANY
jgi:hypothetical protein